MALLAPYPLAGVSSHTNSSTQHQSMPCHTTSCLCSQRCNHVAPRWHHLAQNVVHQQPRTTHTLFDRQIDDRSTCSIMCAHHPLFHKISNQLSNQLSLIVSFNSKYKSWRMVLIQPRHRSKLLLVLNQIPTPCLTRMPVPASEPE